jgi:hypothetical protein
MTAPKMKRLLFFASEPAVIDAAVYFLTAVKWHR